MEKILIILCLVLVLTSPAIGSGFGMTYFVDPSTVICFSVVSATGFHSTTCVPCDKIPMSRLKFVLTDSGWKPLREMTPEERDSIRSRIKEKYGRVTGE
jgi:hypothetical protein